MLEYGQTAIGLEYGHISPGLEYGLNAPARKYGQTSPVLEYGQTSTGDGIWSDFHSAGSDKKKTRSKLKITVIRKSDWSTFSICEIQSTNKIINYGKASGSAQYYRESKVCDFFLVHYVKYRSMGSSSATTNLKIEEKKMNLAPTIHGQKFPVH